MKRSFTLVMLIILFTVLLSVTAMALAEGETVSPGGDPTAGAGGQEPVTPPSESDTQTDPSAGTETADGSESASGEPSQPVIPPELLAAPETVFTATGTAGGS